MDTATDRSIDVLFVGRYSRHHSARAKTLEVAASLAETLQVVYCLDSSRLTVLAESSLGRLLPLKKHRRPKAIAKIVKPPGFGRQLYDLIGTSKIVLNGAIDMAGNERGNMRCFEAMGCGALLVSDIGNYPDGMEAGVTMEAYASPEHAAKLISTRLENWPRSAELAAGGRSRISQIYSKSLQFEHFVDLVARI
jgi:hypothetical protein